MAEVITCSLSLVHSVLSSTRTRKAEDLILPLTSLVLKERDLQAWFLFWPMEPCSQQTPSAFLGKRGHLCWMAQPGAGARSVTLQPPSQLCWGNNLKKSMLHFAVCPWVTLAAALCLLSSAWNHRFCTSAGHLPFGRVSRQADQILRN